MHKDARLITIDSNCDWLKVNKALVENLKCLYELLRAQFVDETYIV